MNKFTEVYNKIIAEANEAFAQPTPEKLYKWEITFRMQDENGEWKGGNKRTVIAPTQVSACLKFKDLFTDEENARIDPKVLWLIKGLLLKKKPQDGHGHNIKLIMKRKNNFNF